MADVHLAVNIILVLSAWGMMLLPFLILLLVIKSHFLNYQAPVVQNTYIRLSAVLLIFGLGPLVTITLNPHYSYSHVAEIVLTSLAFAYGMYSIWYMLILHCGGTDKAILTIRDTARVREEQGQANDQRRRKIPLLSRFKPLSPETEYLLGRAAVLQWVLLMPISRITLAAIEVYDPRNSNILMAATAASLSLVSFSGLIMIFGLARLHGFLKSSLLPNFGIGEKLIATTILCVLPSFQLALLHVIRGTDPANSDIITFNMVLVSECFLLSFWCYFVFSGSQFQHDDFVRRFIESNVLGVQTGANRPRYSVLYLADIVEHPISSFPGLEYMYVGVRRPKNLDLSASARTDEDLYSSARKAPIESGVDESKSERKQLSGIEEGARSPPLDSPSPNYYHSALSQYQLMGTERLEDGLGGDWRHRDGGSGSLSDQGNTAGLEAAEWKGDGETLVEYGESITVSEERRTGGSIFSSHDYHEMTTARQIGQSGLPPASV